MTQKSPGEAYTGVKEANQCRTRKDTCFIKPDNLSSSPRTTWQREPIPKNHLLVFTRAMPFRCITISQFFFSKKKGCLNTILKILNPTTVKEMGMLDTLLTGPRGGVLSTEE